MNEHDNKKKPCEHEWKYIGKSRDLTFYDYDGNDYYVDVELYMCEICGDLKLNPEYLREG